MKDSNLKLAQQDIEEALSTVEAIETCIKEQDFPKEELKKKFMSLAEKVQQIEDILKDEGII